MKIREILKGALRNNSNSKSRLFALVLLALVFLFPGEASALSSYWKNYFSIEERKAVQKNAEKYTISEIESKSNKWKGIIRGYNIKNGSISDDDIEEDGITTNKIRGLGDYINEKISDSSTPQDFSADNLTGTYAALNGSQITNLNPTNITGSGNLNIGNGDLFVDDTSGNVGIGTTVPARQLDISKSMALTYTTNANQYGIIYKGTAPFVHDFNYGNNGTTTLSGGNTFVGENAGNLTMGSTASLVNEASYNTFIGNAAGFSNTTGYANSFVGNSTGKLNTTGYQNTASGYESMLVNTSGYSNVSMGYQSLYRNTDGSRNVAMGVYSMFANTVGRHNTSIGTHALQNGTTGNYNVAIGSFTMQDGINTGDYNIASGFQTLYKNTSGSSNVAIGLQSLYSNTVSSGNVAIGSSSLLNAVSSSNPNTAVGNNSGKSITTGYYNTFIGNNAGNNALQKIDAISSMALGNGSYTTADNQVVIGSASVTQTLLRGNVGIGTTTPATALDVNGQVKIQKSSAQPFDCDATHDGTIALTSGYLTCVCKGGSTTWVFTTDGTTSCTW